MIHDDWTEKPTKSKHIKQISLFFVQCFHLRVFATIMDVELLQSRTT